MIRFFIGSVLAAAALLAQTTGQANIVGNVYDTTGSVIAGAKVTVVSAERQFTYNATTNRKS